MYNATMFGLFYYVDIMEKRKINPFKKWYGSHIPEWLLSRKELSAGAKLCYSRLLRYAGRNNKCNPKIETLANELGVSDRQCSNYLKELKDVELIGVIRVGLGRSNQYEFYEHEWSMCYDDDQEMKDSSDTDMKDSSSTDMKYSSDQEMKDSSDPIYEESQFKENQSKRQSDRLSYLPEDKRKEFEQIQEKSKYLLTVPIPETISIGDEYWIRKWLIHLSEMNKRMTTFAQEEMLHEMQKLKSLKETVRYSMANGYKSLIERDIVDDSGLTAEELSL